MARPARFALPASSVGACRRAAVLLAALSFGFVASAFAAPQEANDVVHFDNGDRLTGSILQEDAESLTIDVAQVGVLAVPKTRIARVEAPPAQTGAAPRHSRGADHEAEPLPALRDWDISADVGLVVASGNTRTADYNLVLAAERVGERFDNILAFAARRASARIGVDGPNVATKDQRDLSYGLRWRLGTGREGGAGPKKSASRWYAVANFEYFADPLKNIERRFTGGLGLGHALWASPRGALTTDLGVSQVFETLSPSNATAHDPALRWGVSFKRWLVGERLEAFYNHQFLWKLGSQGSVWDADTGVRLHLTGRWRAGLRVDVQHETPPTAGRGRTDASYAIALGATL